MAVPAYATPAERAWYYIHRVICGLVLLFLIAPILVVMPLSFNAEPYFSFPLPGLSLRWYAEVLQPTPCLIRSVSPDAVPESSSILLRLVHRIWRLRPPSTIRHSRRNGHPTKG